MENTYWNQKGKYQEQYDQWANELMPMSGTCETVAGEMIRAASKLGYDFYNNGMGNDTTGALNYLRDNKVIDVDTYKTIVPYTGEYDHYYGKYDGDSLQVAIESMVDQTIEKILAKPELLTEENTEDIFDYY